MDKRLDFLGSVTWRWTNLKGSSRTSNQIYHIRAWFGWAQPLYELLAQGLWDLVWNKKST